MLMQSYATSATCFRCQVANLLRINLELALRWSKALQSLTKLKMKVSFQAFHGQVLAWVLPAVTKTNSVETLNSSHVPLTSSL
jgi:hypothetical protein